MTLKDYYAKVSKEERLKIRQLLCAAMGIEYYQFDYRRRTGKWSYAEKSVGTQALNKNGYENIEI